MDKQEMAYRDTWAKRRSGMTLLNFVSMSLALLAIVLLVGLIFLLRHLRRLM